MPSQPCTVPSGKEREHNFQPGDNVEVCEGELINLQGKVLSVDGNKITIMPKHEDLKVMLQDWPCLVMAGCCKICFLSLGGHVWTFFDSLC